MGKDNCAGKIFPFELIKLPTVFTDTDEKHGSPNVEPFIEKVKKALETDLQDYMSFGCKINNCHTHAGSKIHFKSFVEAELLFHNSYYNERFASLTVNYIQTVLVSAMNNGINYRNILLIGYEKYSELFLTTLRDKIISTGEANCEYCIYETNAVFENGDRKEKAAIRRLKRNVENSLKIEGGRNDNFVIFERNDTLCLFIVPINTSLSTMDKIVAKFTETVEEDCGQWDKEYLCLITLYFNNEFFDFCDVRGSKICFERLLGQDHFLNAKEKFEHIANKKIKNFVASNINSSNAAQCTCCFPDKSEQRLALTDESPMFGVNRGSVVPMLKFGHYKYLKPIKQRVNSSDKKVKTYEKEDINANLKRVWRLSQYMEYRHVARGDNHFQFYFHTDKFLEREIELANELEKDNAGNIEDWLKSIRRSYKDNGKCVFDYLVAPRHATNAQFVYLVKNYVFNNQARIIFFDVDKEYRSNLTAKYSDLISAINNIKSSNLDYEIRFHFVDDMINSGTAFLNAQNLISSIISETVAEIDKNIYLFYDGILLINRMSEKRRNFYTPYREVLKANENYKNFHYFVNVNISPMRNHEDACTLCKLGYDYKRVRENCATNSLADICSNIILTHAVQVFESVVDGKQASLEKRYLLFIAHLINERLSNKFCFDTISKSVNFETEQSAIESEKNSDEIKKLLDDYYRFDEIKKCIKISDSFHNFKLCDESFIWEIAFIKSISRPFFIYHIRSCQAAFAFCLERLNTIISLKDDEESDDIKNSMRIQTLVKALADMNANYIIRKDILDKLIRWANGYERIQSTLEGRNLSDEEKVYISRRLFKPDSLLHYIKKDLVLSRDTTKSLLLEHILLNNSEEGFFDGN